MSKEYTNELMIDFGTDGSQLIPVVLTGFQNQDCIDIILC